MKKRIAYLLLPSVSFFVVQATAQEEKTSSLYHEIIRLDSLLFDEGFNKCNFEVLSQMTSNDLEFYHDQGGITLGKELFL